MEVVGSGLPSVDSEIDLTRASDTTPDLVARALQSLASVGMPDVARAFNPIMLQTILGHANAEPQGGCNDPVDTTPFSMPLSVFINAFYVEGIGESSLFKRRAGFPLYMLMFHPDCKKFLFTCEKVTHCGMTGEMVISALMRAEVPQPPNRNYHGAVGQLRVTSNCSVSGCPASRQFTIVAIKRKAGPQVIPSDTALIPTLRLAETDAGIDLQSYEIFLEQKVCGPRPNHNHSVASGMTGSRGELDFHPFQPHLSFVSGRANGLGTKTVKHEPDKVAQRCDFNNLPVDRRPPSFLLGTPELKIAPKGTGTPTTIFANHQHAASQNLGEAMFEAPVQLLSIAQAQGKVKSFVLSDFICSKPHILTSILLFCFFVLNLNTLA